MSYIWPILRLLGWQENGNLPLDEEILFQVKFETLLCWLRGSKAENKGKKEKEMPKDCAAKWPRSSRSLLIHRGWEQDRPGGSQEIMVWEAGGSNRSVSTPPPPPIFGDVRDVCCNVCSGGSRPWAKGGLSQPWGWGGHRGPNVAEKAIPCLFIFLLSKYLAIH